MNVTELSEKFGADDLLTAYLMRNNNMSLEDADAMTYTIGFYIDQMLDRMSDEDEDEDEEEEI